MVPPQYPAGAFDGENPTEERRRIELIAELADAPRRLGGVVGDLTDTQLDTVYKNWSIRQIANHLADSHVHVYIRFKWTLTEDHPTIKAYDESLWAALPDSRSGDVRPALALLEGVHLRWVALLRSMRPEQFQRTFHHPESHQDVQLSSALASYAWHCRHHIGQIEWLRQAGRIPGLQ